MIQSDFMDEIQNRPRTDGNVSNINRYRMKAYSYKYDFLEYRIYSSAVMSQESGHPEKLEESIRDHEFRTGPDKETQKLPEKRALGRQQTMYEFLLS
jgi:hypothetical protein